jgi:alpha-N-arabinofuranosidase
MGSCRRQIHPSVTIHTDRQRAPISKYIYGQFIEHLGRCIYGGLWAEMLEDRKFYYPVTDTYQPWGAKEDPYWKAGVFRHLAGSPWKVIGPPGSVDMETDDPFVGEHTPVVHMEGNGTETGISQEGLALVKGKGYTGRVVLAGDADASPVEIRLTLKNGKVLDQRIEHLDPRYRTYPLKFESPVDDENAVLEIISQGKGVFKIGTVSLMPDDHIHGWRADVIRLLKELRAPIYRWPGGNFVSGYNWRDGIGDPDRRPPRKNPAWTGVEHNDVGIHEYMELMDIIDAEPFIAVNTGLGTIREADEEVAYCNDPADTPLGRLRAGNGHPGSFNVKWWAVGNEMYGSWQLGYMPLSEYVKKHNRVAESMRQVDPSVRLVAVGSVGIWSETMLRECSDHMNLISEHVYCQEMPGLLGHTGQLAEMIRWKAGAHRSYRENIPGLREKDIRIAMDEWNFWYGDYIYGELGVRYFLKDGLGVAIGLHEFFRNSDLYYMANYAQTVNVIGCIKTTRTEACFAATGVVLKLYREHFGSIPVEITGTPGVLDIAAAWTENRKQFTLAVVNPTRKHLNLPVDWEGISIQGTGTRWIVTGPDPMIFNEPGEEPAVFIKERSLKSIGDELKIPALSICVYSFPANSTE